MEEAKQPYLARLQQEWEAEKKGVLAKSKAAKAHKKASRGQLPVPFTGKPLHVARKDGKRVHCFPLFCHCFPLF